MNRIELARPLEAYFSFAELAMGPKGRRFTITFTYTEGGRLDRLQWWWHLDPVLEKTGGAAEDSARQEAVGRFRAHIETWLINSRRRLNGGEPFPQLESELRAVPDIEPQRPTSDSVAA